MGGSVGEWMWVRESVGTGMYVIYELSSQHRHVDRNQLFDNILISPGSLSFQVLGKILW